MDGVNLSTAISACKGAWLQALMLLQARVDVSGLLLAFFFWVQRGNT